tara:strand:- start:3825 stop:4046 length:222 start_codon:yes stop_codon:yes gene_type:complete
MKNTNNMSFLTHLKRTKLHYKNRWVVKYDGDLVREVKLIYNPDEYRKMKTPRKLHTQKGLIKILENDKRRRNP